MRKTFFLLLFQSFVFTSILHTQSTDMNYQDKVSSLDNILHTLYDVISGDAGKARDWDLFRHLFTENAKLIPTRTEEEDKIQAIYLTPEEYIERSGKWLEENGFHEKEIFRKVSTFGSMTQVFSTYASYRTSDDTTPFMRGINSIQLMDDGDRWWIINIYWVSESKKHPIPTEYLPK